MIYPILLCLLVAPFHSVSQEVEDKASRREAEMLGGWHNMPLDSKTVKRLQGFVEESHNRESNSEYWYKIKEVLSAKMQVVNGFNFDISLILEPTGCLKNDMDSDKECLVMSLPGQKVEECQIEIYEPIPKFVPEIKSKSCNDWTI
ncbi:cystatin-like 1 [Xenopus laevis]|nr:cystatin-like 1 [Xenopus laevis]